MIPFDIILDGRYPWPELAEKEEKGDLMSGGTAAGVAIAPWSTGKGRPAVLIRIDLDDGVTVIGQTSARLFCTAARAIMAKYPDLFEGE